MKSNGNAWLAALLASLIRLGAGAFGASPAWFFFPGSLGLLIGIVTDFKGCEDDASTSSTTTTTTSTGTTGNGGSGGCDADSDDECGGQGGEGGTGAGPTTTTGNGGSGGSGGSEEPCYPSVADPFCTGAPACECPAMSDMPPDAPCPFQTGNVCGEQDPDTGDWQNGCGCDLPPDDWFQLPTQACLDQLVGTWWENSATAEQGQVSFSVNDYGQITIQFGVFQPASSSFSGFVMFSKDQTHYATFGAANTGMLESCVGTFSLDCSSIEFSCTSPDYDPITVVLTQMQ